MMKIAETKLTRSTSIDLDIRVIGIGGAGCSSLSRFASTVSGDAQLLGIDTESATHSFTGLIGLAHTLSIGTGFGSGGDPEKAADQFPEVQADVESFVDGADVVIVLAGLGRGTGSGVSPLVCEIARNAGALTIAAVNLPFEFEGRFRSRHASRAHEQLSNSADAVITISNDDLSTDSDVPITLNGAFQEADNHIANTVHAITAALRASAGRFDEVRNSMRGARKAVVLSGSAEGLHAGDAAVARAFSATALTPTHVKSCVIHVDGGIGLSLGQVAEAVTSMRARIGRRAEVHVSSERHIPLGSEIRITLVLAGGDYRSDPIEKMTPQVEAVDHGPVPRVSIFDTAEPVRTRGPMLLPAG
jgi:cell division protein FtsZ